MNFRKLLLGMLITFGILSSHQDVAAQGAASQNSQKPQAGVIHPGTAPGAVQATSPGTHSGKSSGEKDITPVKQELIEALKTHKDSPLYCREDGGKNHMVTPAEIEKKETKVKKKQGEYIIKLSSGTQVTCSKKAH